MTEFRIKRSRIYRPIIVLAAGLALSFSVAIACTIMAQLGAGPVSPMTPDDVLLLSNRYNFGEGLYHRATGQAEAFSYDGHTGARLWAGATGRLARFGYREYRLTAAALAFAAGKDLGQYGPNPWTISEIEAGWPLRCFRRSVATEVDFDALFAKAPTVVSLDSDHLVVPIRPFWGRLALNTLFYAVLIWLVMFAPGIVRRWSRARQDRCTACGYPLGASDRCSECGHTIPPTVRRPQISPRTA